MNLFDPPIVREGVAVTGESEMRVTDPLRPSTDCLVVRAKVYVMSMSEADMAWLDQNCPPEWRDHVSGRLFETSVLIPRTELDRSKVDRPALMMAHKLGYMLGEEINKGLEPLYEGLKGVR